MASAGGAEAPGPIRMLAGEEQTEEVTNPDDVCVAVDNCTLFGPVTRPEEVKNLSKPTPPPHY